MQQLERLLNETKCWVRSEAPTENSVDWSGLPETSGWRHEYLALVQGKTNTFRKTLKRR